jgi:hypothetical protein
LIVRPTGREFYDLADDPRETKNLLAGALSADQRVNFNALHAEHDRLITSH